MSTSQPVQTRPRVPMDPRIKDRRVAVARQEGRRRLRLVLAAAGALAVAGGGFLLTRSAAMDIDHLVVSGAEHTPAASLRAAARTDGSPQIMDYDTAAARRRIEALPWVLSARVTRAFPNRIEVSVVERDPVAALPARGGWAVVDGTGRILDVVDQPGQLVAIGAPTVRRVPGREVAPDLRPAIAAAEALARAPGDGLRDEVRAVVVSGKGRSVRLGLQLAGGGTVTLGDTSALESKLTAAATVLQSLNPAAVDTLDVRVPSAPVLRRKGADPAGAGDS